MSNYNRNGKIIDVLLNIGYDKKAYGINCNVIKWKKNRIIPVHKNGTNYGKKQN